MSRIRVLSARLNPVPRSVAGPPFACVSYGPAEDSHVTFTLSPSSAATASIASLGSLSRDCDQADFSRNPADAADPGHAGLHLQENLGKPSGRAAEPDFDQQHLIPADQADRGNEEESCLPLSVGSPFPWRLLGHRAGPGNLPAVEQLIDREQHREGAVMHDPVYDSPDDRSLKGLQKVVLPDSLSPVQFRLDPIPAEPDHLLTDLPGGEPFQPLPPVFSRSPGR